jgi:DNA polymerase-4
MNTQFTTSPPTVLYVDINSCFATIEQQAHPKLQGKPVAVAAYETGNGVILAASYEAKRYGVKTGMRIYEARRLCPLLQVTTPDPEKYRFINERLKDLVLTYSPHVQVQSIDEMIVRMDNTPFLSGHMDTEYAVVCRMRYVGMEIKRRIREEIGERITVSIGIASNAFLAKTASNLKKPDGLEEITATNIETVLGSLPLMELCGIKQGNGGRLLTHGITNPLEMYRSTPRQLEQAFGSIIGRYWWLWLHGFEGGSIYAENQSVSRKSYSQSSSLTIPTSPTHTQTIQVISQLVAKMAARLREDGCSAGGIMAGCSFRDRTYWQKHVTLKKNIYATEDIFSLVMKIFAFAPEKLIHTVFVGVFTITNDLYTQTTLDDVEIQKQARTKAIDTICRKFGNQSITTGIAVKAKQMIVDRIAFGKGGLSH